MSPIVVASQAELDAALAQHAQDEDAQIVIDSPAGGGGLHIYPTPRMARAHYYAATRWLEVVVPVADLRPLDETKAKSRSVTVLREVDLDGDPIEVAS